MITYKEIKKINNLTDSKIAEAFGYKNVQSFKNSSKKEILQKGIEFIYNLKKSKEQ